MFTFIPPGDLSISLRVVVGVPAAALLATGGLLLAKVIVVDFAAGIFPGTRETGTAILAPVPFVVVVAFRTG